MEREQTIHSPETGSILRRAVRPYRVFYGEASMVIDAPGWYPDDPADLDSIVFEPRDCKVINVAFQKLKREVEGLGPPL